MCHCHIASRLLNFLWIAPRRRCVWQPHADLVAESCCQKLLARADQYACPGGLLVQRPQVVGYCQAADDDILPLVGGHHSHVAVAGVRGSAASAARVAQVYTHVVIRLSRRGWPACQAEEELRTTASVEPSSLQVHRDFAPRCPRCVRRSPRCIRPEAR